MNVIKSMEENLRRMDELHDKFSVVCKKRKIFFRRAIREAIFSWMQRNYPRGVPELAKEFSNKSVIERFRMIALWRPPHHISVLLREAVSQWIDGE